MAWYRGTGKENHKSVFENVSVTIVVSFVVVIEQKLLELISQ
jgi:hypothetical protein